MGIFDTVRDKNVTARQVAEHYGVRVNRNGMGCCPFHDDKHPSMKFTKRYYCFGCGATGDAVDFVANHFGLSPKDAAEKLLSDLGYDYDKSDKYIPRIVKPKKSLEKEFEEKQAYTFRVLSDYLHTLRKWRREYAPKIEDEEWHPLFCEALANITIVEYLLDVLIDGDVRDRALLLSDYRKKVKDIDERLRSVKCKREGEGRGCNVIDGRAKFGRRSSGIAR